MDLTPAQIAEAFSGHQFARAYPYLAPDLRWVLVGGPTLVGAEAAIAACEETVAGLSETTTRFTRFKVVVGETAVVVDSVADYAGADGTVTVASCDLYDFSADGLVVEITSYTVEIPAPDTSSA